jgi:hypothetical protein
VNWQWGEIKTGGIWSMAGWFWHWVRMPGGGGVVSPIVRGSSGTALGIVWMDGCVFGRLLGVVSPTGIYWLRIGSVNSLPLVLVLVVVLVVVVVGGCDDMRHRYGATICATDMVRRYGATICKAGNRKGQERIALGP